jgi:hypothetical protein
MGELLRGSFTFGRMKACKKMKLMLNGVQPPASRDKQAIKWVNTGPGIILKKSQFFINSAAIASKNCLNYRATKRFL